MRGCEKAREANECMNGELVREEIEEAMKEMRESAPGEDGVRLPFVSERSPGPATPGAFRSPPGHIIPALFRVPGVGAPGALVAF